MPTFPVSPGAGCNVTDAGDCGGSWKIKILASLIDLTHGNFAIKSWFNRKNMFYIMPSLKVPLDFSYRFRQAKTCVYEIKKLPHLKTPIIGVQIIKLFKTRLSVPSNKLPVAFFKEFFQSISFSSPKSCLKNWNQEQNWNHFFIRKCSTTTGWSFQTSEEKLIKITSFCSKCRVNLQNLFG